MADQAFWRWALLLAFALAVAASDLRRRLIPNALVAAGLGAALALAAASGRGALGGAGLGSAVFGGPLLLVWIAGALAGGGEALGAGDCKAALALGALLGMPAAMAGLFWGALAGGLLGIAAIARGLWRRRQPLWASLAGRGPWGLAAALAGDPVWGQGIPYGVALAAGAVAAAALIWRP